MDSAADIPGDTIRGTRAPAKYALSYRERTDAPIDEVSVSRVDCTKLMAISNEKRPCGAGTPTESS